MTLPNLVDGMNFAQWPPNLANVALYSSKNKIIQKYNIHVDKFLSQIFFWFGAHQMKIIGFSLSKLEINALIHEKKSKHNMNQFNNRNNLYGSKILVHTITKSLIILGS